jgi:hypothetical protein
MVDERTLTIIHLEHANKQQDFELTERVAVITSLEQQGSDVTAFGATCTRSTRCGA